MNEASEYPGVQRGKLVRVRSHPRVDDEVVEQIAREAGVGYQVDEPRAQNRVSESFIDVEQTV